MARTPDELAEMVGFGKRFRVPPVFEIKAERWYVVSGNDVVDQQPREGFVSHGEGHAWLSEGLRRGVFDGPPRAFAVVSGRGIATAGSGYTHEYKMQHENTIHTGYTFGYERLLQKPARPVRSLRVGDQLSNVGALFDGAGTDDDVRVEAVGTDWVVMRPVDPIANVGPLFWEGTPEELLKYLTSEVLGE